LLSLRRVCRAARPAPLAQAAARRARCICSMPPPPGTSSAATDPPPAIASHVEASPREDLDVVWQLRHIREELPEVLIQAFSRQNMSAGEINKLDLQAIMSRWQRFPGDTGSPEVQIAVLTHKLRVATEHMQRMKKDTLAKRKLDMIIQTRVRMLKYLRRTNRDKYYEVLEGLGIRATKAFEPSKALEQQSKPSALWQKVLRFSKLKGAQKRKAKKELPRMVLNPQEKRIARRKKRLHRRRVEAGKHEAKYEAYLERKAAAEAEPKSA